jgi:hypothetical protein
MYTYLRMRVCLDRSKFARPPFFSSQSAYTANRQRRQHIYLFY